MYRDKLKAFCTANKYHMYARHESGTEQLIFSVPHNVLYPFQIGKPGDVQVKSFFMILLFIVTIFISLITIL